MKYHTKYTTTNMQQIAKDRNGLCLSEYTGYDYNIKWKCNICNSEWFATPNNIIGKKSWCRKCSLKKAAERTKQKTLKKLKIIISNKGGKYLSKTFRGIFSHINVECDKGHIWNPSADSILNGKHWCPTCSHCKKANIKEMQELAKTRQGECLSKRYYNSTRHLKWRCKEKHEWLAVSSNIRKGHWCPYCANQGRYTLKEVREIAVQRKGKCLSKRYVNANSVLKWQCEKHHTWNAAISSIVGSGHNKPTWCPYCSRRAKHTIERMQEEAKNRNGKCLSNIYVNCETKLKWECEKKHIFYMAPKYIILREQWCPECSVGKMERFCRETVESIFHKPFPKTRPDWLVRQMHIDCYNEELKLAIEYNGAQHYIETFFHKGKYIKRSFKNQQERDELKRQLCKQNNTTLIEVPYTVKAKDMKEFILEQCKLKSIPYSNQTGIFPASSSVPF